MPPPFPAQDHLCSVVTIPVERTFWTVAIFSPLKNWRSTPHYICPWLCLLWNLAEEESPSPTVNDKFFFFRREILTDETLRPIRSSPPTLPHLTSNAKNVAIILGLPSFDPSRVGFPLRYTACFWCETVTPSTTFSYIMVRSFFFGNPTVFFSIFPPPTIGTPSLIPFGGLTPLPPNGENPVVRPPLPGHSPCSYRYPLHHCSLLNPQHLFRPSFEHQFPFSLPMSGPFYITCWD